MKLIISEKHKKDLFISLFSIIKKSSSHCNMIFEEEYIHIQGMDKTHICLYDVKIFNDWFNHYERNNQNDSEKICFDSDVFHSIINAKNDDISIHIFFEGNADNLNIDLINNQNSKNKGDFNKHFKIPLVEFDYDVLELPNTDYDAEFSINSTKICDIASQMGQFGNDLHINCDENKIELIANGMTGEMLVNIQIDDLDEYSIVEGETLSIDYSLMYINKICLTNKLSNLISFSISKEFPMKINYDLGVKSHMIFYIAAKV